MNNKAPNNGWWRGGVIYQIYPRSYQDSNGDGVGDLAGITERLPYIADLGADGIWISPFFKSPMKDFGYDVSDYNDVDPLFGDLADLRRLVDRAHELGLKVLIDQVLSHSSDQHPWFIQSSASRDNPQADWYVWADAKHDGTPPNNWLSIFGGSAWQWHTRRQQYFLHNFLSSQPDLNFHCPALQDALLDSVRFWLEFGVDGYRLDTVNFYVHDALLRDNPGRGMPQEIVLTSPSVNPYCWQWHQYDKSQPENLVFLQRLRALLDQYPHTTMVGEIGDDDGLTRVAEYTGGGDKLHMAYCFELMSTQRSAPYLHDTLSRFDAIVGDGWPCWALTNHDVMRVATRWWGDAPSAAQLQLSAALQMSLRGTPCLYQGDELGLPEADVALEDVQDPYGLAMWPEFKGRDGCRTPMVWDDSAGAGFSSARPWLPVAQSHREHCVSRQAGDSDSMLTFYTRLLKWRKTQSALVHGRQTLLDCHPQVLAFLREQDAERLLCVFNFSESPARWDLPADLGRATPLEDAGLCGAVVHEHHIELRPWGCVICHI